MNYQHSARHLLAFALVAGIVTGKGFSTPVQADKYEDLVTKYDPHSIYLTRSPAHDLKEVLSDTNKFEKLAKLHPRGILEALKKFLDDTYKNQATGLAFLHLDLVSWTSGFKRASDHHGTLTRNPWTMMENKDIAVFLDAFLNGHIALEDTRTFIADERRRENRNLMGAWTRVQALTDSPYIPASEVGKLFSDTYELMHEASKTDLESLKLQDGKLYDKLELFRADYERNLESSLRKSDGLNGDTGIELFPLRDDADDIASKLFPFSAKQKFEIGAGLDAFNSAFDKRLTIPDLDAEVNVDLFVQPGQE